MPAVSSVPDESGSVGADAVAALSSVLTVNGSVIAFPDVAGTKSTISVQVPAAGLTACSWSPGSFAKPVAPSCEFDDQASAWPAGSISHASEQVAASAYWICAFSSGSPAGRSSW